MGIVGIARRNFAERKYSLEDVEEALAVVQEFDPGRGVRHLRECLLTQLRTLDSPEPRLGAAKSFPPVPAEAAVGGERSGRGEPETPLARLLQANQLKRNCQGAPPPGRTGESALWTSIKKLDPRRASLQQNAGAAGRPDVYFRKVDDSGKCYERR